LIVELIVSFDPNLNPKDQTLATLLMTNLSSIIGNDGSFLIIDDLLKIPINANNTCIVYNAYEYCLNDGECFVEKNSPTCRCNPRKNYTYSGEFCEAPREYSLEITSTSKPSETVLVLSIVLPMIAFIILGILLFLSLCLCYKK
jgi:hypothetical protein